MPRPERALDPSAGPVEALAAELRKLREEAGSPGYRELAVRSGFSVSTLANAAGGRRLPSLAVTLGFVRACGGDPTAWEPRWRQVATAWAAQQRNNGNGAGDDPDDADPPYLGLSAYGVADADRFFGRDRTVGLLVDMLSRQRFVAVFGVSGSGKSSLLRAGLVAAMSRADHASHTGNGAAAGDGGGCRPVLVTPGTEPLAALRGAVGQVPPARDMLLVVDQFEELFTLCKEPAERTAFVAELAALAEDPGTGTRVVIAVRADFYGRCAALPRLAGLLAGANVPIGPLTDDELHEVVTKPARQAGLTVERALVTKVMADAAGQPGALPLVSHALLETWRQRRSDVLTVAGYEAAGGMAGAIAQTAEEVYGRFDAGQRDTVREVMVRLVTLGEGVQDTRRRANRDELDLPGVDAVLHDLAAARLVVLGQDTVEVAHEALVGAWPRLHDWLHDDRDALRLHRQLTEASRIWLAHDRDPGALYRGTRLAAWEGRDTRQLNALERTFLAASQELAVRETAARRRRVRLALTGLTAAVVVTTVLAGLALWQTRRANEQRDLAVSRLLVANARGQLQVDQEVALLLARQAYDTMPTEEAQSVLRQAFVDSRIRAVLPAGQGQVLGVAYSTDGRQIASSGSDGTVRVWQHGGADTWQQPRVLPGHTGFVRSPVFSVDGRWLAAVGIDRTVTVWDLTTDAGPVVLRGHTDDVLNVAFSPDGRRLASTGNDGTVRIWDPTGRRGPRVLRPGGPTLGVAFSPDGHRLAVGGDGPIWIWDAAGNRQQRVLRGHEATVKDLAFSPDGRRLASAGSDHTVRVWDVAGTDAAVILRGNDGYVESVAFSPDGRRLVSSHSGSNTIRVWSAASGDDPLVLRGHDSTVWSVAFSPDGRRVASGSNDGTVRFWDAELPGGPLVLRGHAGPVWSVAVSQDGQRTVSGGADGALRIWDAARDHEPRILRGHDGDIIAVAMTPDGRWAASGGRDRTVRIWNTDGAGAATVLRGHERGVLGVAFSPDGQKVASASGDSTVRIWSTTGAGTPMVLRGHRDQVRSVAFSPDGRQVASTDNAGIVRVWNVAGPGAPVELRGHPPGLAWTVAFSPDGRRVASGGQDGSLRIWDADGQGQPLVLRGHQGSVWTTAFSPDGQLLASASDDGSLRIWDTATGTGLVVLRGHNASVEQVAFAPDRYWLITAHGDGTIRRWQCDACGPIDAIQDRVSSRVTRELTPEERHDFLTATG